MHSIRFHQQDIYPSKIVCIGRNYVEHIHELGNTVPEDMVVFLKPNSALSSILHAKHNEPLHFEAELAFLYQQGKFTAVAAGLDLTKRGLQSQLKAQGLPWERAKAFDGSALFSEFVAITDTTSDGTDIIEELSISLYIDNVLQQQGGVAMMMYSPKDILQQLSQFMTLMDGDIVMTGTPKGVGRVVSGKCYKATVSRQGEILVSHSWEAG
ncbi:fumarylacetoacetate hydrolase family protein [Thalassotalea litorea]|uniref:Fumarylacetoacetate hydrolase family protein n=1 Tax=Thalassotalea litorea TaxID=2020715 RepID=A0A5R9IHL9_9GAMM|nr:fumarylacetoacetate hydrolase family protein [Thalassotalea litorea]TLU64782.1 fumarylacetoacetate hydrolase family protein [Thalassotalea litorea]